MELYRVLAAARRQMVAEQRQMEAGETEEAYDEFIDAEINALSNVELLELLERAFS